MYPILIVRAEIICLAILLFITLYSSLYKMGKDQGNFLRICVFAIGHVIFDLITVLTVNNLDTVAPVVNKLCHIIFYMFALLFAYEFFCYTVSLCYSKNTLRRVRRLGLVPLTLYLAAVPFLGMEYLSGCGTNYSFGPAAIVGYGVAMVFFLASIGVVLRFCRVLDKYVVGALLPMLGTAVAAELIQVAVPELLFTGGTVTIITVGFFFSLENPVAVLRQKVQIDAMTGVKSRHSYEADIVKMDRQFAGGSVFGMVFCDINDLKAINDTRGHLEGDAYIACVAQLLMSSLKNADVIYRMGGDEFLAVYQDKSLSLLTRETAALEAACREQSLRQDYPVSLSIGYALSDRSYKSLRDVLRTADYQMYANKARLKRERAYLLGDGRQLNIMGLTDRMFDAFASTDSNRFLFVTNMTTNVTRWSHAAVEYFGLAGEFVYDCRSLWLERIHPDDRNIFFDDLSAVYSGQQRYHDLQYRILDGSGNYVSCSCTGTVLRGKNGDPDLFAGTMQVLSASESIDHITELRNGYEMMNYLDHLIRSQQPAALLKVSILNLSRINMLYGYQCGSDILKQFALVLHNILGGSGSVFRSNGTKFVICLPDDSREAATELYHRIQQVARQRIHLEALTPPLQLAAGAYMLPAEYNGTSAVLHSSLIFAHEKSKYEKRGQLVFHDQGARTALGDSKEQLLTCIHQDAITTREGFYLVYQPIVCAANGKIVGAEALVRWANRSFGTVSPDDFIPWLEGDPCFCALGNWILRTALAEVGRVLALDPDFTINVNIAMPQLESEGFRGEVLDILAQTGFPPGQLCLELTERCRELSVDTLKTEIEFFRGHGVRVALDDLGTGFSSFGLLLNLNVDEIKLDRTFVREVQTQRVNQILTRMIVEASRSMGYSTCLEGVETQELRRYLEDFGATYYQGYYCSPPQRIEEFMAHLLQWNGLHSPSK